MYFLGPTRGCTLASGLRREGHSRDRCPAQGNHHPGDGNSHHWKQSRFISAADQQRTLWMRKQHKQERETRRTTFNHARRDTLLLGKGTHILPYQAHNKLCTDSNEE